MRKTVSLVAGALALLATPLAAATAPAPAPAKPAAQSAVGKSAAAGEAPKMTPAQLANFQRGVKIMRLFTAAFTSDKVSNEVKGRLIACFYANDLAKISAATGQALTKTPGLDEAKPADLYRAAAGVCGVVFKRVDAAEAAKSPPNIPAKPVPARPATAGAATTGR